MYITILYGGQGAERAVSLASGLRVAEALIDRGHRVHIFDFSGILENAMLPFLRDADAVFLALHGDVGEGGALQAMLEEAGIKHYTGSTQKGAMLAMNKALAKKAVKSAGLPVTTDWVWQAEQSLPSAPLPLVLKPLCGGSSVGLVIAREEKDLTAISPKEPMLIEPLLVGREYTVGILNGQPLPVVEIRPQGGVYDYRRKYTVGEAEEICPAPIPARETDRLQKWAKEAFHSLSLRDFARIDFKEDEDGIPHFLEANTLPGMTKTSLLPLAAEKAGIAFPLLCEQIALLAAKRKK